MPIWVDADACPRPVKEILFNAADRPHTVRPTARPSPASSIAGWRNAPA